MRPLYRVSQNHVGLYESEEAVMEALGYDWYEPQLGQIYLEERDKGQRRKRGHEPIVRALLGLTTTTMFSPQRVKGEEGGGGKSDYSFYSVEEHW